MVKSGALTEIKASTGHDSDDQAPDARINQRIDWEYRRLRRELIKYAPTLYVAVHTEQTLTTSDTTYDLPSDFERIKRFERQYGSIWQPVYTNDGLHIHTSPLSFREEVGAIQVSPTVDAPGTYRLVYWQAPSLTGDYTILVPEGLEEVIVERVAAWVRVRMEEDPAPHQQMADRIWNSQKGDLMRRYGEHPVGGLKRVRGDV